MVRVDELWPGLLLAAMPCAQEPMAVLEPFVRTHCLSCHGGETTKGKLDLTKPAAGTVEQLWRWHRLAERVQAGEMPPPDAERPAAAERAAFGAAVERLLRAEVPRLAPDPGRVTVRRLSRSQWAHCVQDLFGVDVATNDFPVDDLGYGFDTIGDALTFSTLHLERYLAGAREVATAVFHGEDPATPTVRRVEAETMRVVGGGLVTQDGELAGLLSRASIATDVTLPRDGVYRLRVHAGGDQAGDEPVKMLVQLDGRDLATIDVAQRRVQAFELTAPLTGGARALQLTFLNDLYLPDHPDPARRDRNLRVDALEVVGPLEPRPAVPAQAWLTAALAGRQDAAASLDALVRAALPRVWRRPVAEAEASRLVAAGRQRLRDGEPLLAAQRFVLQAMLASPHFLFRIEPPGSGAPAVAALPPIAVASRLSFFLWASTPDQELLDLARSGRLVEPATLLEQADRLLADPRADRLASEFAAQWLELRSLAERTPDPARFPGCDEALRASMRRETELLFLAVLREGRDVRELLDCDFTHVDARLAAFYGWPALAPAPDAGFVRVTLPAAERERGGVLGHASILTLTSNPTRTSPVKRGKWILENLLGQPPPPPPPGNDSLANEAKVDSSRSFREQLAEHRERAACAACHVRMDALGFALERYDAIGRHRLADAGGPIDSSGQLPDGSRLEGLADLKRALVADGAFRRTLLEKLFVQAVGRELRPVDRLRLGDVVAGWRRDDRVALRDLVRALVSDPAFVQAGPQPTR